jgi:biofilm PGA synthesis N-glycosyltransferase PgaC
MLVSDPKIKYKAKISLIIVAAITLLGYIIGTKLAWQISCVINIFVPYLIMTDFYLSVKQKYILSNITALLWSIFSYIIAERWIYELSIIFNIWISWFIVFGIAIIPGYMNAFMVSSLFLDLRPPRKKDMPQYPPITILIAAYNEGPNILSTLESINRQQYPGEMKTIVINDGSKDDTLEKIKSVESVYSWLEILDLKQNGGKAAALNYGLDKVTTDLTITIDGDCYLFKDSLKHLVERYSGDPTNTGAVAGAVLVRNSRKNLVTRVQEWDYFHGIAAIKRIQSLYQGTLVAQGAFSLYRTDILRTIKGWPHCVGEDIVLTWNILNLGYRVGFAEDACLFTNSPDTWLQFIKQRQRWSRGLIEAFKSNWKLLFYPRMSTLFIWWNLLFPYMDVAYTLAFIPGLILALFGIYWIAGPLTLLVLPLAMIVNWIMYSIQSEMFVRQGLRVRRNIFGFIFYALMYSIILQPACVLGYIKEIINGSKKSWGTK